MPWRDLNMNPLKVPLKFKEKMVISHAMNNSDYYYVVGLGFVSHFGFELLLRKKRHFVQQIL